MDLEKYMKSGIIEQYVLGLSSPEERHEVERLAAQHPEINEYIIALQDGMEQYAEMHAVSPPPRLKSSIMQAVDEDERLGDQHQPVKVVRHVSLIWRWGAGIAAMMILALSALCYMLYQDQQQSRDQISLLSTQIKHLQDDYQQLQVSSKSIEQRYVVLKDTGTHHVQLHGSDHAPQAQAVVYWNPQHNKGFLNLVNMPQAPHGHQYQVWADVNGKHIDLGLVESTDPEGNLLINLPYIENSRGFVITLEKEGGSVHPTVEQMYAHGEL